MQTTQNGLRVPLFGLLALMVLSCLCCPALTPVSFAEAQTRQMSLVIEITINTRANPADPTFVVAGILTIVLNVKTGQFTGDITPGAVCPLDPQSTECPQQTAVLFDVVNGSIVPHEEVTQLKVEGQILRRAVNMIVRDVGGTGRHIFALGTTENDPGDQFESDVGRVAGPAVGPEAGEGGDWQLAEVRGLTRQVGNEIDE